MKKMLFFGSMLMLSAALYANNIQIANTTLGSQNTGNHSSVVTFDVSWENSWRTSTNESNYDGAWVFVKFRKQGTSLWQHATLAASAETTPAGSVLKVANDYKGAWIYRDADGIGNVDFSGAQLRWNYGADSVHDNDSVEVRVFAVEMVYVPEGAFYAGSGGTENHHFYPAGADGTPYSVTSEEAITLGNAANGDLMADNLSSGTLPAIFPKGYNAFWIMKYEASQQQYVDFLRCLDQASYNVRHTVDTGTFPNIGAQYPERAADYISFQDEAAYADWAAMRPFTELEYEKACRGANQMPVANEYPWGNTTITLPAVANVINAGLPNETVDYGNCNYGYNGFPQNAVGALRCGVFATVTSDRVSSGAGYYGAMELSGNVGEFAIPVSFSNTAAQAFSGSAHGDGKLNSGNTDVANWTALVNSTIALRGGSFTYTAAAGAPYARTSDRYSVSVSATTRSADFGLRLARTAE